MNDMKYNTKIFEDEDEALQFAKEKMKKHCTEYWTNNEGKFVVEWWEKNE